MVEIVETPMTTNCNRNENSVSCTQRINDATNNNTNNNDEEKTSHHHSISSNKTNNNNTSSNNKSVIDSRAYSIETYEKRFQESLKKLNAQVEYICIQKKIKKLLKTLNLISIFFNYLISKYVIFVVV